MRSAPPPSYRPLRSLAPGAGGSSDAYADLLRDSRGLRREQSHAREQWLARLPEGRREEIARMLAGAEITAEARAAADRLIRAAG